MELQAFREVWAVDFEFRPDANLNPDPVCLVAWELKSNRRIRLWQDEFGVLPPYPTDSDVLFVAYYAAAEIGCHLALNWAAPERILDLFTEVRRATNGRPTVAANGLLGALMHHGLDSLGAVEKYAMRELIVRGGLWSSQEKAAILDYCESDVAALAKLLPAMAPTIDLPRALLRGRYMAAVARMERTGTPLDAELLGRLTAHWERIEGHLIERIDAQYHVYDGTTFKHNRFAAYLRRAGISWPVHESGHLDLSDDTFREMARVHPGIAPLHELRHALGQLRLNELAVGADARNRTMLSAFRSKTGRNQPSNSRFIFGPSTWLRSLIKPPPGHGVAYIDWKQQEFGIAAALSGDRRMMNAYSTGDPYLAFAKQAGAVPTNATQATHKEEREVFKACVLAVQYGMGEISLAQRIGKAPIFARELLALHRRMYPTFWGWSDEMLDDAMLTRKLQTVFGWPLHVASAPNPRSLRNFHMQANGAEMLRLACCMATEQGIQVCAPIHDAVLICAPLDRLDADVQKMRAIMADASRIILDGFELGTSATEVRYPDRYRDERGRVMWDTVMGILDEIDPPVPPVSNTAVASSATAPRDMMRAQCNTSSILLSL